MANETGTGQMPQNSYVPENRGLGQHVDRSQESYKPSPYAAERVVPHTTGYHEEPAEHSLTSKVVVYGGAAVAAAALTAGAVLAVRKVVDIVSGNDEIDREADRAADLARDRVYDKSRGQSSAPRFAEMSEREREAIRSRTRANFAETEEERARLRREARTEHRRRMDENRPRRPRPAARSGSSLGFLGDIENTAQSLTRNLNGIVGAVGAAMAAFRSVADQAEGVVREFHGTADHIRSFLGTPDDRPRTARSSDPFKRPARRDVVDLRDEEPLSDDEARTHRL